MVHPHTPYGPQQPKSILDIGDRLLHWFEQYIRKKSGMKKASGGLEMETPAFRSS
jgi:hypothetical protein